MKDRTKTRQAANYYDELAKRLYADGLFEEAEFGFKAAAFIDSSDNDLLNNWGGAFNGQEARRNLLCTIIDVWNPEVIVETGTFRGATTEWFAKNTSVPILSCEKNRRFFLQSKERLSKWKNVYLKFQDSRDFIRKLAAIDIAGKKILFYLDAHWEEDLPLREELLLIFKQFSCPCVIIDDFKVPFDAGYCFDDYGYEKKLSLEILEGVVPTNIQVAFPSTPACQETGMCRGCVILTHQETINLFSPTGIIKHGSLQDWRIVESNAKNAEYAMKTQEQYQTQNLQQKVDILTKQNDEIRKKYAFATSGIRKIAVDLTPVLCGGENGGAKIFAIELLKSLAEMMPYVEFILLTHETSHNDLAIMDKPNMRRRMIVQNPSDLKTDRLGRIYSKLRLRIPLKLNPAIAALIRKFGLQLHRNHSRSLLQEINADLLFCPFTAPTYFEPGIPTVCTIYDLQYKTYPEFFSSAEFIHRDKVLLEACKRASMLAAISDYSKDTVISYLKYPKERIKTIYLRMANRVRFECSNDNTILDKLGLITKRYLFYPANFWKHKNHEMLITAFGLSCNRGLDPDIKLVCTGVDCGRKDFLQNSVRSMGMEQRIIFSGYLSDEDFFALLRNSKGMIFPSLYEGFGLPVIEAMAAGVPVACSNITSLPEIAANAAILFDPRIPEQITDTILSLINDDRLCERLVVSGYDHALSFSDTGRMALEYIDLFRLAAENNR